MKLFSRFFGWLSVAVLLIALIAIIAIEAVFSVSVTGDSMRPTLKTGDRLLLYVPGKNNVQRFDVIEAMAPIGTPVVKRVIGLPGDGVEVIGGTSSGDPVVLVKPAGSSTTYRVENANWSAQIDTAGDPCCRADGTSLEGEPQGKMITVPPGNYWVIGDNWGASEDSRTYGFITSGAIHGTANFMLQPFGSFGPLPKPARLAPYTG